MNTKNHEHIMRILVDLIEFNGNLHDTVSGLLIEEKLPHIITDLAQFIKNNDCFVDTAYQKVKDKIKRRTYIENGICPECGGNLNIINKSTNDVSFDGCTFYHKCSNCVFQCTREDY